MDKAMEQLRNTLAALRTEGGPDMLRQRMNPEARVIDVDNGVVDYVGSDQSVDRYRTRLVGKWELANFRANPVFLWSHNYEMPPIGTVQRVTPKRTTGNLEFRVRYVPEEIFPFARMILEMVSEGFLRAVSVGFIPGSYEWSEADEVYDLKDNELLELSQVNVPANPNALANAVQRNIIPPSIQECFVVNRSRPLPADAIAAMFRNHKPETVLGEVREWLQDVEAERAEGDATPDAATTDPGEVEPGSSHLGSVSDPGDEPTDAPSGGEADGGGEAGEGAESGVASDPTGEPTSGDAVATESEGEAPQDEPARNLRAAVNRAKIMLDPYCDPAAADLEDCVRKALSRLSNAVSALSRVAESLGVVPKDGEDLFSEEFSSRLISAIEEAGGGITAKELRSVIASEFARLTKNNCDNSKERTRVLQRVDEVSDQIADLSTRLAAMDRNEAARTIIKGRKDDGGRGESRSDISEVILAMSGKLGVGAS